MAFFVFFAAVAGALGVATDLAGAAYLVSDDTFGLAHSACAGIGVVFEPIWSVHINYSRLLTLFCI